MLQRIVDFFRPEQRQVANVQGPIGAVVSELEDYYSTPQAEASQTAAVEIALGMIYRAFLLAEPTVPAPMLTPEVLGMMASHTVGRGNSVWEIDFSGGAFTLLPAAAFEVKGGIRPRTWRYAMEFYAPGRDEAIPRNVAAEGVVHTRYKPSLASPWLGVSPLVRAGVTAQQLARIEKSLSDDARIPTGMLMPSPDGATTG